MLRTRNLQPSLWESVLPEVCLRLPLELERVDAWLDDDAFFEPFRVHFDARLGRPSVPIETYLRLMFLKFRYRLGYETLCREVADSISWRRFCRIDIDGRVPHPTALMKITTRCGETTVAALNETLLAKAVEAKVVKTGKVRADTTGWCRPTLSTPPIQVCSLEPSRRSASWCVGSRPPAGRPVRCFGTGPAQR